MKIIFLDIDGVLNYEKTFMDIHIEYKQTGIRRVAIDELLVENLKLIVDATGAKIVLSSAWRGGWDNENFIPDEGQASEADKIFKKYGLSVFSVTPRWIPSDDGEHWSWRENEIKYWLENTSYNIESFVIIDDETFDLKFYEVDGLVVKTRENRKTTGLQLKHVQKAIEILNKK